MRTIGATRFDLKYSNGTLPHEAMMGSIERYAHARSCRACASCSRRPSADAELDAVAAADRADAAAVRHAHD